MTMLVTFHHLDFSITINQETCLRELLYGGKSLIKAEQMLDFGHKHLLNIPSITVLTHMVLEMIKEVS